MTDEQNAETEAPITQPAETPPGGGFASSPAFKIGLTVLAALFLLIIGGVSVLMLQRARDNGGDEVTVRQYEGWRLTCGMDAEKKETCALSEEITRDIGGTVLTLAIPETNPKNRMTLIVPLGVLIEAGMGFSIGNAPMRVLPYETCSQVGCVAYLDLTEAQMKALLEGTDGQVVVQPSNGSPVPLPFQLAGFVQGYAALQAVRERRDSLLSFLDR